MRQKMPVRVWPMVILMVFWVFYIHIIVLTMETLGQLVSVGYLVATLLSLVGIIANFVVFTANNWQMPVRFSLAGDTERHCTMTGATRFNWLGDRFVLPVPYYNMFEVSIGDICLIFGLLFFLIFFSIHIIGKIM